MPKSMAGKYDGRKQKVKVITRERSGPKPHWEKHLARNTAAKLFRECNVMDRVRELIESKDDRLRWQVIQYVWDRLEGKPFTAVNPLESKAPSVLNQDNRLQVSIQQLLPSPKPKKQRKVITAQLVESTDVIEAGAKTPTPNEK